VVESIGLAFGELFLFDFPSLSSEDPHMINVVDAGANGNNNFDNWSVLQGLINDGEDSFYFPPGRFKINKTLVFPRKTGYHIIGAGISSRFSSSQPGSAITWGGASLPTPDLDGPMVEYGGTGIIWDGVALWGKRLTTDSPVALGLRICNSCSSSSGLSESGKAWFKAMCIEDCLTAIKAEGTTPADSCAFGYFQPRNCGVAVELDGTGTTMFTFRFVLPTGTPTVSRTIFKVTQGGRIYVAAINMLGNGTILDVQNGDDNDAFYHINGLKVDGNSTDLAVLNNVDDGNGLQLFRFTDAQFYQGNDATVLIDRTGGNGQSVLEFVGARWMDDPLVQHVTIKGASSSKPSRLIVRDSMLASATQLINTTASNAFRSENRIRNWTLDDGVDFS
jgi:hypothetical protein